MRTTTLVGLILIGLALWLTFNPPGPGPGPVPIPVPTPVPIPSAELQGQAAPLKAFATNPHAPAVAEFYLGVREVVLADTTPLTGNQFRAAYQRAQTLAFKGTPIEGGMPGFSKAANDFMDVTLGKASEAAIDRKRVAEVMAAISWALMQRSGQ